MPINWKRRKYTEDQFISAWNSSSSIAEAIRQLGLNRYGSTYDSMRSTAEELNLSRDHMTGQGHLKGKTHNWTESRPLSEVLVVGRKENNGNLVKRMIKAGLKQWICENCSIDEWLGNKISLELDHIDGNNHNNRIENLKLLCPNCHSQTPTWRGRNKGRYPNW